MLKKLSIFVVLTAAFSLTLGSCKKPPEEDSATKEFDGIPISQYLINVLFQTADFQKICQINEILAEDSAAGACFKDAENKLCKAGLTEADKVTEDLAGQAGFEKVTEDFTKASADGLRNVVVGCIKAASKEYLEAASKLIATKLGIAVVQNADEIAKNRNYKKALANWACTGGAKALGNAISTTRSVDYDNACSAVVGGGSDQANLDRAASCFRSAGDICSIVVSKGDVNLDNFLPETENEISKVARELASEVASGACKLGATTTQAACSVINAAAAQIKEAILTGNNDWASCVGTTQLGACLGTIWGSNGWTNNNGVATAVTEQTESGENYTYVSCCICNRNNYIYDYGVIKNLMSSGTFLSVIQSGDYNTGNCAYLERQGTFASQGEFYSGKQVYVQYEQCGQRYVAGDRCATNEQGIVRVWNPNRKAYEALPINYGNVRM